MNQFCLPIIFVNKICDTLSKNLFRVPRLASNIQLTTFNFKSYHPLGRYFLSKRERLKHAYYFGVNKLFFLPSGNVLVGFIRTRRTSAQSSGRSITIQPRSRGTTCCRIISKPGPAGKCSFLSELQMYVVRAYHNIHKYCQHKLSNE